jgi:hypothetical protein
MRWKEAAAMDMDKNPVQEKPMSIITSKLSLSLSLSLSPYSGWASGEV